MGWGSARWGAVLVGATQLGVCAIAFGNDEDGLVEELRGRFPKAELKRRMDAEMEYAVRAVVAGVRENGAAVELPIDVRATAFQQSECGGSCRAFREGRRRTYGEVAAAIGAPTGGKGRGGGLRGESGGGGGALSSGGGEGWGVDGVSLGGGAEAGSAGGGEGGRGWLSRLGGFISHGSLRVWECWWGR